VIDVCGSGIACLVDWVECCQAFSSSISLGKTQLSLTLASCDRNSELLSSAIAKPNFNAQANLACIRPGAEAGRWRGDATGVQGVSVMVSDRAIAREAGWPY
jgi:hypothetical protein